MNLLPVRKRLLRGRSPLDNIFDLDVHEFSKLLNSFFNDFDSVFGIHGYKDDNEDYVMEIEIPGFSKSDIKVELKDGIIEVIGKRETKNKCSAGYKEIHKRIPIGEAETVTAEVKDGILYLTVKSKEEEKPIEVEVT